MRLLETSDGRTYRLTEEFHQEDVVPAYTILSHTWEEDSEVIFNDLVEDSRSTHRKLRKSLRLRPQPGKKGYDKLDFCASRTRRDGLRHFWVDTCCIDKTNYSEVQFSINSMFEWYKSATKCYVYLSDVSISKSKADGASLHWQSAFAKSRWFTRGWTLQELLAPAVVEFYSREGIYLGNRLELRQLIHDITDIPILALSGASLDLFSVDEKLSWAVERQTKREEDEVYALLGIFGIKLPFVYDEGYDRALRRLLDNIEASQAVQVEGSTQQERLLRTTIPFRRDRDFIPRNDTDDVYHLCKTPAERIALVGLGGAGKSQIAIDCCYRMLDDSALTWVFWVHAETRERLREGYLEIAKITNMAGWDDPKTNTVQLVHTWLGNEANGRWLLVLDSADDMDVFAIDPSHDESVAASSATTNPPPPTFLPRFPTGSVLVTSRSHEVVRMLIGAESSVVEVGPMNDQDAFALLKAKFKVPIKRSEADALITALDHMPLALTQAAAFIQRTPRMSISKYLKEISYDQAHLPSKYTVDTRRDPNASNSIMTTWQISFDYIRKRSTAAAQLLALMCMFDRQGIPRSLLVDKYAENGHKNSDFDHDMYMLTSFCLVKTKSDGESFEMHGLVQSTTRKWLHQKGELMQWKETSVSLMNLQYPVGEYENAVTLRSLYPHAQAALNNVPKDEDALEAWASLSFKMAWYKAYTGNHEEAYKLILDSYDVRRLLWGIDAPSTLDSLNSLAMVLNQLGRYDEAKEMHHRAIEGKVRTFGANSWDTLVSMINLASLYNDECQWTEAEKLLLQALNTSKKSFGPDHTLTLDTTVMLANTYRNQSRWNEAAALELQMLDVVEMRLGLEHPRTLAVKGNLAFTYRQQGRLQDAEQLQLEIIDIYQAKPDPGIQILAHQLHLASTYKAQGRLDEAEKLQLQILDSSKQKLGSDHFDTLTRMSHLSATYWKQGRYKDAEELDVQTLDLRMAKLGHDHVLTLDSKADLAMTYRSLGQMDKAEKLDNEVVEAYSRKYGDKHSLTLHSKAALAHTYREQGRLEEAAQLEELIVKIRTDMLGPEHPDTLGDSSTLAVTYKLQGRMSEARELMERCLKSYERAFGADHTKTVLCRAALERWKKTEDTNE